jgi:membrane associated rhomboid family serine protease
VPDGLTWFVRMGGVAGIVWAVLGPIFVYRLLKRKAAAGNAVPKYEIALSFVEVGISTALLILAAYSTLAPPHLMLTAATIGCLVLVIATILLRLIVRPVLTRRGTAWTH